MTAVATREKIQRLQGFLPSVAVLIAFFVIPLAIIVVYSFMTKGPYGGVIPEFSLDAYRKIILQEQLDGSFRLNYPLIVILWRSVFLAFVTTVLCLLIGFPAAYVIAQQSDRMKTLLLIFIMIPFWSNLLIRTIVEVGITAISCTPSYPAVLEQVIADRFPGLAPRDLGLKLGLFGGEAGLDDPALRARLRDTWGMEPRNANYGVSDVFSNFGAECPHDSRLHFMAADVLYPELIDPETGSPVTVEPGARGELVLTHLVRDCQPLVRFRTGDIIAIGDTGPCACGCTGFRFSVIGRSDDMVVVRGLNMFPTMVAAVLNEIPELSGDYRITLETPPPYDSLPVQAELAPGVDASPELARRVEGAIKARLGASARVVLCPANSFPRTEGKTKRVIRSLP